MPSRRQFLLTSAAIGAATLPGAATATDSRPQADVDAALSAFGSGAVDGHIAPRALPRLGEAVARVAAEAPDIADQVSGRLPSTPGEARLATASDDTLGALADADIRAATAAPAIDGVDALAVGIDFTARGPVVRARVTGADGAPSRAGALDAFTQAGLPVAALEPFAIADGDDLALYAGLADRDGEQPFVLAILLVVLAAVIGTFVLGLGDQVSNTSPQASFTFEYSSDLSTPEQGQLRITHDGGDSIPAEQLRLRGDGVNRVWGRSGRVGAGDSVTVADVPADAEVRIIWTSGSGDTATLGLWTGPEA